MYVKDGKIIAATKEDLLYSPDNGRTWQSYDPERKLPLGSYALMVFEEPAGERRKFVTPEIDADEVLRQEKIDQENLLLPAQLVEALSQKSKDDYYGILGINLYENSCLAIKSAYLKRNLVCHPDKSGNIVVYNMLINACAKLSKEFSCGLKCESALNK